jgi:tRNA wybutosine-synthesizing protein 2
MKAWTLSRATAPSDNLAVRTAKEDAEAVLSLAVAGDVLDKRRKVLLRGDYVEIPVTVPLPGYPSFSQELPEFYKRTPGLGELFDGKATSRELRLLPRGWYILGEILIVKISPELEHLKERIGEALLTIYPRCKTVLRDLGIKGSFRQPVREVIAGSDTETVHRENGVTYRLDALRIMFSQGNLKERMRMGRLGKDEFVVDMFAGIGYFTLPMAVHSRPRRVMAIELNPLAYGYLRENVRQNRVDDVVEPTLGDCREMSPVGEADRVVMGYVGTTDRYLRKGIEALRPGGILHYHQTVPSWLYPAAAIVDVTKAAKASGRKVEILQCTRVKKYSPGVLHAVVDARIGGSF